MIYGVYAKASDDLSDRTWVICGLYDEPRDATNKALELLASAAFSRVEIAYVDRALDKDRARDVTA